jgi:hypothetical protein
LLCRDPEKASKLPEVVENHEFEFHPVTGEMELEDAQLAGFRRLDEETLQSKFSLEDHGLVVIYLWCMGDDAGGESGWKVAEVSIPDDDETQWHPTVGAAGEAHVTAKSEDYFHGGNENRSEVSGHGKASEAIVAEEDDDDDAYWRQYDRTPGPGSSPAPPAAPVQNGHKKQTSEDDYYAQYATVQPALDQDDPEPTTPKAKETNEGLDEYGRPRTDHFSTVMKQHLSVDKPTADHLRRTPPPPPMFADVEVNGDTQAAEPATLASPRPSSPRSNSSDPVRQLEKLVSAQSTNDLAIKQHISTSIKSLYRLSRAAGLEKDEFEELVKTELDVLSMMEETDFSS